MNAAQTFRIATRSSELALRQARLVADRLLALGVETELVTYQTAGDRNLAQPLSQIGAKGLFTRELEEDLAAGRVHCCVHSLKDLPTTMPDGLVLGAILEREDPRDALVVHPAAGATSLAQLPAGSRVGTSSLRRRSQLLALRRDLEVVELRGNVPTRIRKVDERQVDAAILAAAGLHRLDLAQRIASYLAEPEWLPAAGQGAIAVQVRADDPATRALAEQINDPATAIQVRAERAFLAALEGGCQVPIGGLAVLHRHPTLYGFIGQVDGGREVRGSRPLDIHDPERSGRELAEDIRARGGGEILAGLHRMITVPAPQPE